MLTTIMKVSRKKVRQNSPLLSQPRRLRQNCPFFSRRGRGRVRGMKKQTRQLSWATFRNEDIAQAPDGLDIERIGRIRLDQFAQAGDLYIQAAVEYFVFAAARHFHQLFTRQRLT